MFVYVCLFYLSGVGDGVELVSGFVDAGLEVGVGVGAGAGVDLVELIVYSCLCLFL